MSVLSVSESNFYRRSVGPTMLVLGLFLIVGCSGPPSESIDDAAAVPSPFAAATQDTRLGIIEDASQPIQGIQPNSGGSSLGAASQLAPVPAELLEEPAVLAARDALARDKGLEPADIGFARVEEVTWPDSSLGCASPDAMYMPVLTPGFRVTLAFQDQAAIYHTDRGRSGTPIVVRCDPGRDSGAGLRMLAGDALDAMRLDLEERFGTSTISLDRAGVVEVPALGCDPPGTRSSGTGFDALPKIILEHVFIVDGTRHYYRSWLDEFVYCGEVAATMPPPTDD